MDKAIAEVVHSIALKLCVYFLDVLYSELWSVDSVQVLNSIPYALTWIDRVGPTSSDLRS